jgi:Zn-dependent peptidase ImmA (M78 family)/predicted secreted protein
VISFQEWRTAELRGAAAARILHDRLGLRDALRDGTRPIDVFDAIRARSRTLVFQPLKTLLGAYIKHRDVTGLIVTTERDLHIQRFTAAHELGHAELDHPSTSLDKEIGFAARGPMPSAKTKSISVHEVEADAFASEFLLPKWLVAGHVRRRQWTLKDLTSPDIVYQLSLRLGASYAATCWSLASNSIIPKHAAQTLVAVAPKTSKQRALRGFQPDNWRKTDVWLLKEVDSGTCILGDPNDKLVLDLEEHAASGYVGEIANSVDGLNVQRTESDSARQEQSQLVGNTSSRRLILSGDSHGRVELVERRPWDIESPSLNSFVIDLDLRGPEPLGLPRVVRSVLQ